MEMIISIYKSFPIPAEFSHTMLVIISYIFLPAGIDVFILGILLYKKSKKEFTKLELNNIFLIHNSIINLFKSVIND